MYLWAVVFVEYLGYISINFFEIKSNYLLYNIFYLLVFPYFFSIYYTVLKNKNQRLLAKVFSAIYIFTFIINSFYENYFYTFQTIPYVVAGCFLMLSVIFYFVEVLATEKVLHVKKNLLFWISIGLLLFYAGSIPFTLTLNYYAHLRGINFLFGINYMLIIILNTSFIIGFICSDRKQLY